jgi:hypothetical protein
VALTVMWSMAQVTHWSWLMDPELVISLNSLALKNGKIEQKYIRKYQ